MYLCRQHAQKCRCENTTLLWIYRTKLHDVGCVIILLDTNLEPEPALLIYTYIIVYLDGTACLSVVYRMMRKPPFKKGQTN